LSSALVISFVLLLLLLAIDLAFVSWRYALDDRPARIDVPTADGWVVTAWFRPAVQRRFATPVVLCHGLANNHAFMEFRGPQNLAKFLSEAGFDCFSLDLRGAGQTKPPHEGPWDATFDDHVKFDLPALVDEVCRRTGSTKVAWVGHSLGGAVALAAASTTLQGRLAALVTVGTPVFFPFPKRLTWIMQAASWLAPYGQFDSTVLKLIAPFAGRAPAPAIANATANLKNVSPLSQRFLVANVFAPMWKGVLAQLQDWVRHDVFRSVDGRADYRAGVAALALPVLVVGGTVDPLAPPQSSQRYFELLTSPGKQLAMFDGYGHGDLIVGMHAHTEVYPVLRRFLEGALPSETVVSDA
jgi:pimeloyl-ACP methyl ester carboxylesterase